MLLNLQTHTLYINTVQNISALKERYAPKQNETKKDNIF